MTFPKLRVKILGITPIGPVILTELLAKSPIPILGETAAFRANSYNANFNRNYALRQGFNYSKTKARLDSLSQTVADRVLGYSWGMIIYETIKMI
jgi:hypothetical protein